jgi:NADH:ubiquinone oxidoreductase subunit 5 (subunit L)/multisubunit Na+/H+ antiporter MnhA subunit
MGGLLSYIPLLWVAYVSGAAGLAGLPYWSGYYCKSALWAAALHLNGLWHGVSCIILVNTLFTYVYLLRLGIMIFLGARLGHWSLYRVQWQSPLLCTVFGVLGCVVLYGGSV